jgi:hypothetical protein
MKMSRVILRLIRRIDREDDRLCLVERLLPKISTLSAQLALLRIVGYDDGEGHKLVPPESFEGLKQQWCDAVMNSSPSDLSEERDLGNVLLRFAEIRGDEGFAHVKQLLSENGILAQFLESLASEAHSFAIGNVTTRTELRLPWEYLCKKFGEQFLIDRIADLVDPDTAADLGPRARAAIVARLRRGTANDQDDD